MLGKVSFSLAPDPCVTCVCCSNAMSICTDADLEMIAVRIRLLDRPRAGHPVHQVDAALPLPKPVPGPFGADLVRLRQLDADRADDCLVGRVPLLRDLCLWHDTPGQLGELRLASDQMRRHVRHADGLCRLQLGARPCHLCRATVHDSDAQHVAEEKGAGVGCVFVFGLVSLLLFVIDLERCHPCRYLPVCVPTIRCSAVIAGLLRMIPWIQIYVQDVRNPTIRVLATDFSVLDQQGEREQQRPTRPRSVTLSFHKLTHASPK